MNVDQVSILTLVPIQLTWIQLNLAYHVLSTAFYVPTQPSVLHATLPLILVKDNVRRYVLQTKYSTHPMELAAMQHAVVIAVVCSINQVDWATILHTRLNTVSSILHLLFLNHH